MNRVDHRPGWMAYYVGDKPWHGLGVELDNPPTAEEAIRAAGLDWNVYRVPLQWKTPKGTTGDVKDHVAIVRDSDQRCLGVTGTSFRPLQNSEAFSWFDPIVRDGRAQYHTAGSLRGGQLVWVLAKMTGTIRVGEKDIVDRFVLLSNAHDGTRSVTCMFTPVRVVCSNTLSAALPKNGEAAAEPYVRIRHTTGMTDKLAEAQRVLGMVDHHYERLARAWEKMRARRVSDREVEQYAKVVINAKDEADPSSQTVATRAAVIRLFGEGRGHELAEAKGTAWGLYNAVTEFVDHEKGVRSPVSGKINLALPQARAESRLRSIWLGDGAALKQKAFDEALKLARAA